MEFILVALIGYPLGWYRLYSWFYLQEKDEDAPFFDKKEPITAGLTVFAVSIVAFVGVIISECFN